MLTTVVARGDSSGQLSSRSVKAQMTIGHRTLKLRTLQRTDSSLSRSVNALLVSTDCSEVSVTKSGEAPEVDANLQLARKKSRLQRRQKWCSSAHRSPIIDDWKVCRRKRIMCMHTVGDLLGLYRCRQRASSKNTGFPEDKGRGSPLSTNQLH